MNLDLRTLQSGRVWISEFQANQQQNKEFYLISNIPRSHGDYFQTIDTLTHIGNALNINLSVPKLKMLQTRIQDLYYQETHIRHSLDCLDLTAAPRLVSIDTISNHQAEP